ncbi:hypothetical protein, partial [Pseudotabrizicola sp.]|uniref:hypothetical protein n=1 Tax=Pseudotabrizicola sp. TaxID=2939647 RepID=UPI0027204F68
MMAAASRMASATSRTGPALGQEKLWRWMNGGGYPTGNVQAQPGGFGAAYAALGWRSVAVVKRRDAGTAMTPDNPLVTFRPGR